MKRHPATQAQINAANPDRSTWLSANAGSGKTRVLTDRVARLLLEEVDPQNILCLTYTKAAANEMQNRLFRRLGEWAMLPNAELKKQLHLLGIDTDLDEGVLRQARRLFALAIETPGGLKIQTIHSFCSVLLRRFPLEAGVTPQFREMEERTAELLRDDIVEDIAMGPDATVLYKASQQYTSDSFKELTAEIVRRRSYFMTPLSDDLLESRFGQAVGTTLDDVAASVFLGDEAELLSTLIFNLENGSTTDQKAAAKLSEITEHDARALPILESVFLTGEKAKTPFSAKIGSFPTKATAQKLEAHMPLIAAWMTRVESARTPRLAIQAREKTRALHAFANIFLPAYDAAKQARGWLDFDDLIFKARDLLTNPRVAEWVLFRLDGGIDHILVDEAQDTSPVQWQVIERLAQEFTSGEGARSDIRRTIFVVGDKKQSIYSFQGADPREFDRMRAEFGARLSSSGAPLNSMELEYSFRSSHAILNLVDHTFSRAEQSGFAPEQSHIAFKADMPGRVDLWPIIPKPENEEKPDWYNPVDVKAKNDPSLLLARRIAQQIKFLIDSKHPLPHQPEAGGPYRWRTIQPGDFLILVQRRSDLFHEIIRECKALDLPVAGADRLKVGAELAVRDLAALLSFLATPEDDLSLATALKSPLFGWDENMLYRLAHNRQEKYLWAELRNRSAEFADTIETLQALLAQADYLRPYDLIERILTRYHGRYNLLSRLGPEAEDGIDALLAQAMAYEQNAVDSLTGFLIWMETDDLEVKRQMDSAGNRIRVMTVHGAKGLEAPIVVLPDSGKRDIRITDQIILKDDMPLWRTPSGETPDSIETAIQEAKSAERAERDRLLYVAMTRAENWLIVAAAGSFKETDDTWYNKTKLGIEAAGAARHDFWGEDGLRLTHHEWINTEPVKDEEAAAELPDVAALFHRPAPEPLRDLPTLQPSDLGGAKALPGEAGLDEEAAKKRGRQIHRLLEVLPDWPEDDWARLAGQILSTGSDKADDETLPDLLSEATKVLTNPDLADLFGGKALAEVPITANLKALNGRRIHGKIDLLLIEDSRVMAIDFKSNAIIPDRPEACPEGLLQQMGAYAHALQVLYPNHKIETGLLWTRSADLMMLPHDLVTTAVVNTHIS